jgi:hypothetical protein
MTTARSCVRALHLIANLLEEEIVFAMDDLPPSPVHRNTDHFCSAPFALLLPLDRC